MWSLGSEIVTKGVVNSNLTTKWNHYLIVARQMVDMHFDRLDSGLVQSRYRRHRGGTLPWSPP
jgi:hypothetical protein